MWHKLQLYYTDTCAMTVHKYACIEWQKQLQSADARLLERILTIIK